MKEAIIEYRTGATTVVKHQEVYKYEAPALTICPNPPFRNSISKKLNSNVPTRDLFMNKRSITKKLFMDHFENKTVPELFEDLTYGNDLTYYFQTGKLYNTGLP